MLIERFRHKGLRRLYEDDDPSGLPAESVAKVKAILAALEFAADLSQVATMPGWKLHPLKGDRRGQVRGHGHPQPTDHVPAARQHR